MEAVKIMCQLSEAQINQLVEFVSARLPARLDELSDIDELMFMGTVRICVDFEVDALGELRLLSAEVLNRDWDILDTDSFAFEQYMMPVVDDYNRRRRDARRQHRQIRNERRTFQLC